MFDLMEEGISVVEDITKSRQPFPQMDAIYFVTPNQDNVEAIIGDFTHAKGPRYARAHLFFTSHLADHLFQRISDASALLSRTKTLKEVNVQFLAFESHSFHLELPNGFVAAFRQGLEEKALEQELRKHAAALATVCLSLGEFPAIRCNPSNTGARLATMLLEELSKYKNIPDYPAKTDRGPATLIILDRTIDPLAPILHEFTYQAAVADLLEDEVKNGHYKLKFKDHSGKENEKDVLIDENDQLWTTIRHMHISQTFDFLKKRIQEFQKTNKAAKLLEASQSGEEVSIKQLGEAIRAMPTFQEALAKYSLHQTLTEEVYKRVNDRNLKNYALLEQDLATGLDAEGKTPQNLTARLTSSLNDGNNNPAHRNDKLRLLLTYAITQGIDNSVKALVSQLGLDQGVVNRTLDNITRLGAGMQQFNLKDKPRDKAQNLLSRYTPKIKLILEQLIEDNLSTDLFPYIGDVPEQGSKGKDVKSLKKGPKWAAAKDKQETVSGPRVIVYVIGGVAYSELRAAAELMEHYKREVIIGANTVVNPNQFVSQLDKLS
eukprot:TRINITY_DN791_c0_g2_i5.p1 TRINITY_DN791_c0_g2~~TRINITY_DN791_c0_g2_i5.p1  ORF type:complete len:547 (-),score=201.85 TRINITY_DN791_c0_g2_i5:201-1841(-)